MITNYHRPAAIEDAISLLARSETVTKPIAGGYYINRKQQMEDFEVVDIQALGLDTVEVKGNLVSVEANTRLNQILETASLPESLVKVLGHEDNINLRNQITLPGLIKSADGRSGLLTWLLGTDAVVVYVDGSEISIGDFLAIRETNQQLIVRLYFPVGIHSAYLQVARTPADLPIVCLQLTQWNSGRVRVAVGGFGTYPRLAYDGSGTDGVIEAVRNACYESADEWATAEYRVSTAETLVKRCLEEVMA